MFSALLICTACLAFDQPASAGIEARGIAGVESAYRDAKSQLGPSPDDHVRLALWCEAHGLESERQKHLTIALLKDPAHATARGLLGMIAFGDGWHSPEAISRKLEADQAQTALRAEYTARRARVGNSGEAHWKLAVWCEEHGLKPEAKAHLVAVTQLEPDRDAAWKRLGYHRQSGRWVTAGQIAGEKAEAEAQRRADKHWTTLLTRWRNELEEPAKKAEALQSLHGVFDPRAVPSVWTVFAARKPPLQKIAVQLLGQIDSPSSTRALSILAIASNSPAVRSTASQTLRMRDPRDVASFLVALLRDPVLDPDPILYHYYVQLVGSEAIGSPGILFVRGPRYDVLRYYTVDDSRSLLSLGIPNSSPSQGYPLAVQNQTRRQAIDLAAAVTQILRESEDHVATAKLHVLQVDQLNTRIVHVLGAVIGKNFGRDREAARKWWNEERGYAYQAPAPSPRQDLTFSEDKPMYVDSVHSSCFAADTPVFTLGGPRPIQSLQIGDQVLSQDPQSGVLSYQPVVAALHNKPAMVIKIKLDQDVISATGIHRFWKAGSGWVMARDLKPGDRLRGLAGLVEVKAVESGRVQPVFNLKVQSGQTYFAGGRNLLVHDSGQVEPVAEPFDAVPALAAVATSSKIR
jgi:Pretoxin HINT domain